MNRLGYVNRLVPVLLGSLLLATAVDATLEDPDHIIYGNATLFGDPLAPGQLIELRSTATGELLTSYELGSDTRLGDQFALRIPMDAVDPVIDGRARPGDPVKIFINDVLSAETTVGAKGVAVRLDIDPQNLGTGPSLDITDAQIFEGNSGTTPVVFEVSLNTTSPDSNVELFWETSDDTATGGAACTTGIDYLNANGSLVLTPGELSGSISVQACGDSVIENTEHFRLVLTGVQGGVLARPSATVTIIDDDDVPALRVADVVLMEPAEGATTEAVFSPTLNKNSDFEARFDYATEPVNAVPGTDYVATSGSVTIPAGELSADIPVTILPAAGVTEPKSFLLRFSNPFNLTFDDDQGLGVINDPDFEPAVEFEQDVIDQQNQVVGLASPTALALSPDGAFAYVTSEALDSVLVFQRLATNGRLVPVARYDIDAPGFETAGLATPLDVVVSPDGRHVYVAASEAGAVVVMARDAVTGTLTFLENQDDTGAAGANLGGVRRLQISADGNHLYAAGALAGALVTFSRDPATGALTVLEAEVNGVDDPDDTGDAVESMIRPAGLALSADDSQVYVASRFGDAVQVFDRDDDPASEDFGRLRFVTAYRDGALGIVGLDGAFNIGVSADNAHVYVAAEAENAIVLFDRNPDGTLQQRAVWARQSPDRPGLLGVQGLAISPDGLEVFAGGFADNSLTIFRRIQPDDEDNLPYGDLVVRQTLFDDQGELLNMAGPTAVVPSQDDEYLYVVANEDNAIVVLRRISLDIVFSNGFE